MKVINTRNVEDALIIGMRDIEHYGLRRDSRNGPVLVYPTPVTTVYDKPKERVVMLAERDAHPYFHFMEALWMLGGRNDVGFVSQFLSNIVNFSDDGVTFHGAYGYRWRSFFQAPISNTEMGVIDQIYTLIKILKENPNDRRTVLQMWNTASDLGKDGKDFPCNLMCTFRVNDGFLDMTVFNRSNDMIWGAYGANAVHFSMLQEVMAACIGCEVGQYYQVSTNFHAYVSEFEKREDICNLSAGFTDYELGHVQPYQMVNIAPEKWWGELELFLDRGPVVGFTDPFFKRVAVPMLQSWRHWKDREDPEFYQKARERANSIFASDWRKACVEWLDRRAPNV